MLREIISKAEARRRGLKRYFTGLPCKHGHIAEGYASCPGVACVECNRIQGRRWVKANPEKIAAYEATPERKKRQAEARDRFIARNPERWREHCRRAGAKHNRTSIKRKLAKRVRARIQRFLARGKPGSVTEGLGCSWEFLMGYLEAKFEPGWTWDDCGRTWQLDHIRPLVSFDLRDPEQFRQACHYTNLQLLSIAAHREKTNFEQRLKDRRLPLAAT